MTELWQSLAEDVLAPLLVERYIPGDGDFFDTAYFDTGLLPYHFPDGRWRSLYASIVDLRLKAQAVNWNNLASLVITTVSEDWFTTMLMLADDQRQIDFADNVGRLIEIGNRMAVVGDLQQAAADLLNGAKLEVVVNRVVSGISVTGERKIVDETASGSKNRLATVFENEPPPVVPTGIDFVDDAVGGLREQRMMVLAGAYKSSKTRIMLNWMLSAYRAGKKPAILSYENSIEVTMMQIVAMLAIEKLLNESGVPYQPEEPLYWISADGIMQAGRNYQKWSYLKREAIEYARAELDHIGNGMRFYDRSPTGGDLSDTQSIYGVITRDMRLYGGDVFAVDHQGLVFARGEIYESTRSVTNFFQKTSRITVPHSIHLLTLAQLGEAEIGKKKGGYSAGVKGGGDTSANADYVLRTTPVRLPMSTDGTFYNDRTMLQVKLNRWGPTTTAHTIMFHPESGLYLPPKPVVQAAGEPPFDFTREMSIADEVEF